MIVTLVLYLVFPPRSLVAELDCGNPDYRDEDLHYEEYPYPPYDPEKELEKEPHKVISSSLAEINHYFYMGKRNFSGFRVLIAGGGTGSSLVYFGEQLRDVPQSEIVYLDNTRKSRDIAQRRAALRGYKNVRFILDSIENIPNIDLGGEFDYINCVGVLHHLKSPEKGLENLRDVLKPDGGMGVMVYAKYGRTGVYVMQELMRLVNTNFHEKSVEISNTFDVLKSLPSEHWINHGSNYLTDHIALGESGTYDLFLHKRDIAFSVSELYDFIEKKGLILKDFSQGFDRVILDHISIGNNQLRNALEDPSKMSLKERRTIAEIMKGDIIKHIVYVSKSKVGEADFDDTINNVPFFFLFPMDHATKIVAALKRHKPINLSKVKIVTEFAGNMTRSFEWPVTKHISSVLLELAITNRFTLDEIYEIALNKKGLKKLFNIAKSDLHQNFKITLEAARHSGHILLRRKDTMLQKHHYENRLEIIKRVITY